MMKKSQVNYPKSNTLYITWLHNFMPKWVKSGLKSYRNRAKPYKMVVQCMKSIKSTV